MRFSLLSMKLMGIKNIDKPICLSFSNKLITQDLFNQENNVKAIYGANGSGKTAIILAAYIFKQLVLDRNFVNKYVDFLKNIINQKTNTCDITMTYAQVNDRSTIDGIYSHTFIIGEGNGEFKINYEILKKLRGKRMNNESNWHIVYSVENGELINNKNNFLKDITKNLLSDRSLPSILCDKSDSIDVENIPIMSMINTAHQFAESLSVMLNETDSNYQSHTLYEFLELQNNSYVVDKTKYDVFKKIIDKLASFIKVFKEDLDSIEIQKDEKNKDYICKLILIYSDGRRISQEFESTGIKKLIKLYSYLCDVDIGKVVFVDEFDANMHDVVLVKLVGYVKEYASGQLIFTTHNLAPMDVLQKTKYSIDFLSNDSKISSWVQMGNSSVAKLYKKGLIKYSPFNLETFSFLGVFGDGTK